MVNLPGCTRTRRNFSTSDLVLSQRLGPDPAAIITGMLVWASRAYTANVATLLDPSARPHAWAIETYLVLSQHLDPDSATVITELAAAARREEELAIEVDWEFSDAHKLDLHADMACFHCGRQTSMDQCLYCDPPVED